MENGRSRRVEKRSSGFEDDEENDSTPQMKKAKMPAMASVIVEALKVDSLQRFSSSLEPLLRRIVSEEVERALTKLDHAKLTARPSAPRIQGPEGRNLQLAVRTRMPPHLFTGGKVEGEQGAVIHVVLIDLNTGSVVHSGPESEAKLSVVVLEGDFNEEEDDDWTKEHFESHEVKEREGKRPLLTGDLQVALKGGVGTLGDLTFTDNSSWIRSRKFRLGVKVSPGCCEGIRVREGKTDAFAVKDHRGELYKKHYPPALHDEVWRLDRIAKDGALHKKLMTAGVLTVQDFLRVLVKDPKGLRNILGTGMSNRMWENTVDHAKTCVLSGKLYIYYTDEIRSTGIVFDHIHQLSGFIADGQFLNLESLTHDQKVYVDSLVESAYANWTQVMEYDGEVLNSLTYAKRGTSSAVAGYASGLDAGMERYLTATGNRTQQRPYLSPKPALVESPQLIEFSFVRSNEGAGLPSVAPQEPFSYTCGGSASASQFDWPRPRDGQSLENMFSEELRMRSSEMLQADDMQRLLRTFGVDVGHADQGCCYSYGVPYEAQNGRNLGEEPARNSGKAVVGWLKLKAALRWGIFERKRAAQRRAQLVELD
uniref:Calmodulin-binding protein n=1 Tax=Kalanchoe fedtschenkoi TaxID=63787 RepID=A0A7N0RA65_KALFE